MATIGTIRIGMTTDTRGLSKGLSDASSQLHGFTDKIGGVSTLVKGLFAGLAAGGATAALYGMAKQAAELEDSLATVKAVFGESSGQVEAQAEAMSKAYGLVKRESFAAAGQMGAMFRGVGFDSDTAAEYSNTLSRLAVDYAAAFGGTVPEALSRISSGLRGEVDPLERFGVSMSAANVEAQALAMGMEKVNGAFTTSQVIQARAALIIEQSRSVIGQAAEQASGAAMTINALSGRWEELTTTIGTTFAPVVGDAIGGTNTALQAMALAWEDLGPAASSWAGSTLEALGLAGEGFNVLEVAMGGLANGWQVLRIGWNVLTADMTEGLHLVVDLLAAASEGFDFALEKLTGSSTGLGEQLRTMADAMGDSVAEMRKSIADEWAGPWASDDVSAYFQKARDETERLRRELAAKPMTLPVAPTRVDGGGPLAEKVAGPPKLDEDRRAASERKFAGAALFGSKEAAETILRSKYGGAGSKDAADTAKNTKATADALGRLPEAIGGVLGRTIAQAMDGKIDW